MRLSRDDILKAEDTTPEEVPVPEWGGTVLVRGMTGKERDQFEVSLAEESAGAVQVQRGRAGGRPPGRNLVNMRAKIVARCVVDDDGNRLFSDPDITALGEKSVAPIDRTFTVAAPLSGRRQRSSGPRPRRSSGTPRARRRRGKAWLVSPRARLSSRRCRGG